MEILNAANRLVARAGVTRLTIEAVAQEAGLSKGGVLYHFPTKEALVEGMVEHLLVSFDQDLAQTLDQETEDAGHWLRAYIRASSYTAPGEAEVANSLVAALATYPRLLDAVKARYEEWQQRVEHDGLSPTLATIIRLAVDGLWFAELLQLAPPTGELREDVVQTLLGLARQVGREQGEHR
jgi:AcrR family transcriptional regulator